MAGDSTASLFPTDPNQLTDAQANSFGGWTAIKEVALNGVNNDCGLSSGLGGDSVDPCCVAGSFNGGIAINKFSGDVYVSNECQIGKVLARMLGLRGWHCAGMLHALHLQHSRLAALLVPVHVAVATNACHDACDHQALPQRG